jgi:hypothetical protein
MEFAQCAPFLTTKPRHRKGRSVFTLNLPASLVQSTFILRYSHRQVYLCQSLTCR